MQWHNRRVRFGHWLTEKKQEYKWQKWKLQHNYHWTRARTHARTHKAIPKRKRNLKIIIKLNRLLHIGRAQTTVQLI